MASLRRSTRLIEKANKTKMGFQDIVADFLYKVKQSGHAKEIDMLTADFLKTYNINPDKLTLKELNFLDKEDVSHCMVLNYLVLHMTNPGSNPHMIKYLSTLKNQFNLMIIGLVPLPCGKYEKIEEDEEEDEDEEEAMSEFHDKLNSLIAKLEIVVKNMP